VAVGKVGGVIAAVLYDQDVRRLRAMPGVWPPEFATEGGGGGGLPSIGAGQPPPRPAATGSTPSSSDDSGLPPLEANPNVRRYAQHDPYSEEEEEEEEES
jgi:hypothetical protein